MVPVRKPGRPLSSCPHPSSGPCSCAGVTAAIPKKQACRCGPPGSKTPVTVKKEKIDGETSSGANTPPSPSKATSSSFRVSKAASKTSSRKQSLDPAGLARMDPTQYQILSPTEATNGLNGINTNMPPPVPSYDPTLAIAAQQTPFTPIFQQPPPPLSAAHAMQAIPAPQVNGGSCCGGGKNIPAAEAPKPSEEPTKSCCSTNGAKADSNGETHANKSPPHSGVMIPPQGGTVLLPNGMYAFYQPPTIFNYPPQYGSYMQPLQPEQWRQVMTTLSYPQPTAAQQQLPTYGIQATMPPSAHAPAANGSSAEAESWTSHQCTCGDGCQCVGCAAHPYNDATQNYVRSAWTSMMNDSRPQTSSRTSVNGTDAPDVNGQIAVGSVSPVPPQTPSDATSGLAEEQTLSASDFFFVSYPFADGCEGDMGSCPCGDDCQCIGCVIHGNAPAVGTTPVQQPQS